MLSLLFWFAALEYEVAFKWITLVAVCCLQGCQRESPQPTRSPASKPTVRPVEFRSEQNPETPEVSIDTLLKKGMTTEEAYDALKAQPTDYLMMSMNWLEETVTSPKFPGQHINLSYWLEQEGELSFQDGGTIVYRLNSWSISSEE